MRKYEATTLDFYDDKGRILKDVVTDATDIPDFVKTAEVVDQKSHPELFALVMHDDGKVLKKFATVDAGNTWLSTLYFHQTHKYLPEEAQKVAAARLIEACEHFDIGIPDFLFEIHGSVTGTETESNFVDVTDKAPPMQKVAQSIGIDPAGGQDREEVVFAIKRSDGTEYYPLRDASSVKVAADYFDREHKNMVPRERREYAVKVAHVAKRGALPLPASLKKYASETYSPNVEGHLTTRYVHLVNVDAHPEVRNRLIKIAALRVNTQPEDFAQALEQFDLDNGLDAMWDRDIADPWYSTFALEKVAKGSAATPERFDLGDGIFVTEQELSWLAERGKKQMVHNFGWEVANAFEKNPVAIFKSMPQPQKKVIGKLASSYSPVAGQ